MSLCGAGRRTGRIPVVRVLGGVLLLVGGWLLPALPAQAGDPGTAGVLSLRLGVGARSGAMGETGVAHATDATAVYWNPANLRAAAGTQLGLQHTEYFGLFRQEAFTLSHQTEFGSFGLLLSGFYSDDVDRTELESTGVTFGTFRPYDVVAGLGYALDVAEVSIGVVAKVVYERIDAFSASAGAFDIGVAHDAKIEGLRLAAVVQNLGNTMTLDEEEFDLPRTARLGFSYRPHLASMPGLRRLLTAAEIVLPNDGNGRLHAGAELEVHEDFVVRVGQRFSYDTWGPTFGAGFQRGPLHVDYAFMANDNDFDTTHRFSLRLAYLP